MDDLIDIDEMCNSLNGFEEIAVEQVFKKSPATLAMNAQDGDVFLLMRALLFVSEKRGGLKDADAFKKVMTMRIDEVTARFADESDASADDEGKA